MKRLIIVVSFVFVSVQAGELIPVAVESAAVENAGLTEQLRELLNEKKSQDVEEIHPVVDPTLEADQKAEEELKNAEDLDFEQESPGFTEETNTSREELAGEGVSEHFADAF